MRLTEDGYKMFLFDEKSWIDKNIFDGYFCEAEEGGVYISFIATKQEKRKQGHFSKLLEGFKKRYNYIKVPCPFPLMKAILIRKGFKSTQEYFEAANEDVEVMVWRK